MKHVEIEQRYNALKTALSHGNITRKSFQESVNQLRYKDEQGIWHQLDGDNGTWLRWEADHWQAESDPAKAAIQKAERQHSLPEGFLSLLGLILKNTLMMFFKRLPVMLLFAVGAWVLHTYLLVAVNLGFGKGPIQNLVGRQILPSIDIIIIWASGSMLLSLLISRLFRKNSGPGLIERLTGIKNYYRDSGKDAIAIASGSFGAALIVGTVINAHASLFVAVGAGALVASGSGAVIAILFRSAWTSIFSANRRDNVTQHGLAAGDVTIFALSLGFIANSVVAPDGATIGVILLIVAIAMAKGAKISPATTAMVIPGFVILGNAFFGFDLLWADDGGLIDAGTDGTWRGWWNNSGSGEAIAMGVTPAVAATLGLLFQQGLQYTAASLSADAEITSSSEDQYGTGNILDGDKANNWMKDHGYLDKNGHATQKFSDFMNSMPSESGTELQGFAGDIDENGNPTGHFAIVRDGTPVPAEDPPAQPEEPPLPPEEPAEPPVQPPEPPVQPPEPPVQPPVQPVQPPVQPVQPPVQPAEPIEPEEKDRCSDERQALYKIVQEVIKLKAEERRLYQEKEVWQRSIDNKWWAAFLSFHVDMGNAMLTIAGASVTGGASLTNPLKSVGQDMGAAAIKHFIDWYFDQNPSGKNSFKSAAGPAIIDGMLQSMEEFVKLITEVGADSGVSTLIANPNSRFYDELLKDHIESVIKGSGRKVTAKRLNHILQAILTPALAGKELSEKGFKIGHMKARLETIEKLLKNAGRFAKDAQMRRQDARIDLNDCRKFWEKYK